MDSAQRRIAQFKTLLIKKREIHIWSIAVNKRHLSIKEKKIQFYSKEKKKGEKHGEDYFHSNQSIIHYHHPLV